MNVPATEAPVNNYVAIQLVDFCVIVWMDSDLISPTIPHVMVIHSTKSVYLSWLLGSVIFC